jgi:hypothetical protein
VCGIDFGSPFWRSFYGTEVDYERDGVKTVRGRSNVGFDVRYR